MDTKNYPKFHRDWKYVVHGIERMEHVRCDDFDEYVKACDLVEGLLPTAPFPDDEGSQAHPKDATSLQIPPECPVHGTQMKLRHGKFGEFWSCGTKLGDGKWCNAKPTI